MIHTQTSLIGDESLNANKEANYYKLKYTELEHLEEKMQAFNREKASLIHNEVMRQTEMLHREIDEKQRQIDMLQLEKRTFEEQINELRKQLQKGS